MTHDRGPVPSTVAGAFGGLARALSRVVSSAVLDASSGIARIGEAAHAVAAGRSITPGTLRVRVVILRDERGRALSSAAQVQSSLDLAARAFLDGAGIRIRALGVAVADEAAPPRALDTSAHRRLLWDDIVGRTSLFRGLAAEDADATGIGVPVTVVVVRSIQGRITGCSLGINADWVIVEASLFDPAGSRTYDETVLAHELGHALNLPHLNDPANLMHPASSPPHRVRGTALRTWQAMVLQANRHVIPGVTQG